MSTSEHFSCKLLMNIGGGLKWKKVTKHTCSRVRQPEMNASACVIVSFVSEIKNIHQHWVSTVGVLYQSKRFGPI